ncbi:hypothetical protein DOY81_008047 [Sarcophaga bullata]|nr:hypothetical protein DOY81_008047 [Sarcophaga bullata]
MKHLSLAKMSSNRLRQSRNDKVSYLWLVIFTISLSTAAALFEGCDNAYTINPGKSILQSPYYPNSYPAGSSCRYKFTAPLDYDITLNCTINLDKAANACSTEFFYMARDGDSQLRDSEQFCGSGTFIRKSLFRTVVLAYVSGGSFGSFRCELNVQQQPCDCGWSVNTKITNGQETSVNEFPSMVALRDVPSLLPHFCGGTIISHKHVLTAAHCTSVQPILSNIQVLVGHHNLQQNTPVKYAAIYRVSNVIVHPQYSKNPVNNDIAIYVTTTPIEWSRGVGPICLPPLANANTDFAYTFVDVIGWGTTKPAGPLSNTLQKVNLMVTDQQTCVNAYADENPIYNTQMCTYDTTGTSKDSCQYDSGGPVVLKSTRQFQVGIISYGRLCGEGGYSIGINTRTTSYLPWIHANTGYTICNKGFYS